jgi:3-oxoacyl-[acyl-carrier protein] reductase
MNARLSASELDEIKSETPLGRLGSANEVAELIWFLCSEKADFITGQIITVDGGFVL